MTLLAKLEVFLGKLNLDLPSLIVAVENVAHEMNSALANSSSLENYLRPSEQSGDRDTLEATAKPNVFQKPNISFTADNLGDYLKVEYDFSTHPDDRSKNKKLFALKKRQPVDRHRTNENTEYLGDSQYGKATQFKRL